MDLIERQAAIEAIGEMSDQVYNNIISGATFPHRQWFDGMAQAQSILENLPSVHPEADEWCKDCKEYNIENHNCPRFIRTIKKTVEEMPEKQDPVMCMTLLYLTLFYKTQ